MSRRTKPASQSTSITPEGSRALWLGVSEEQFTEATPTRGGVRNSRVLLPSPGLMRQMEEAGRRQGPPRRRSAAEESPSPSLDLASLSCRAPSAPVCLLLLFFSMESSALPPKADDKHFSPSLFSRNQTQRGSLRAFARIGGIFWCIRECKRSLTFGGLCNLLSQLELQENNDNS